MTKRVAVFGGGIAGLTAAHELICRGYDVFVFDPRPLEALGGKARTQIWNSAALGGDLPGEHGFRFFPAFYTLIDETLGRIPLEPEKEALDRALEPCRGPSVLTHNMINPTYQAWGRNNESIEQFPRRPTRSIVDVFDMVQFAFRAMRYSPGELSHLWEHTLRFVGSCNSRRLVYDNECFWDFMQANRLSPDGQRILRRIPRALVAMDAKAGSARTLLNVAFLLMIHSATGEQPYDRILGGPTSQMWIHPWVAWLNRLGVQFRCGAGAELARLDRSGGRIAAAHLANGQRIDDMDHYIVAAPLECAQRIVTDDLADASDQLAKLKQIRLDRALSWMVGAQFYLKADEPVVDGHVAFIESEWSLTAISQRQFWDRHAFPSTYGLGKVEGLLSVDVSEWLTENGATIPKPAARCSRAEIEAELIHQLGAVKTKAGAPILTRGNVLAFHLDDDIVFDGNGVVADNLSRLLIHPPGFWVQRPTPRTEIENLFLAGDYVQNDMDLATMEGANQSAREAVIAILDQDGYSGLTPLSVDHLEINEPLWVKTLKKVDEWDFANGREPLVTRIPFDLVPLATMDAEPLEERCKDFERKLVEVAEGISVTL